ncbi:MAG: hypothetical protein ABIL58_07015 [Pseudomonadota bacterium]
MELASHREIQEIQVNKILRLLGYMAIPILLINLSRFFIVGWLFSFNIYIIATLFILIIAFNVTKLPYSFKVSFLLFLFLSFAVSQGIDFGMVGFMAEFLLLTVFLSVVFLHRIAAIFMYVVCGLVCACSAFLCITGVLPLVLDFEKQINTIPSWSSFLVTFLFMASIIILIAGDIGNLLAEKIDTLEETNAELMNIIKEVTILQGILPICSKCKKIRDDKGYWYQVELYIERHSEAKFSHSLCEECSEILYGNEEWYIKGKIEKEKMNL